MKELALGSRVMNCFPLPLQKKHDDIIYGVVNRVGESDGVGILTATSAKVPIHTRLTMR